MKKPVITALTILLGGAVSLSAAACVPQDDVIYVNTNVPFAPFEYLEGTEIKGVDVDIMNKVGEKLGKKVKFESTDFDYIIDNVASGKKFDCGAAGITVTDERKEKVDFSKTYFTTIQYVVYKGDELQAEQLYKDGETSYTLWNHLYDKKIGVQRATTGDIYVNDEIDGEQGVLHGSKSVCTAYDDVMIATAALTAGTVDVVVIDKLPAEYVVKNSSTAEFKCVALYYEGGEDEADYPTQEDYAICVTKGNAALLNAINEVLEELLANNGEGINALVSKHLGITK